GKSIKECARELGLNDKTLWNGYNEWDSSKRDLDKEKGSPDMVDQKHSRKYSEEFKRQIVQLHDKG
ncbi:MAG: hypothetical protein UHS51_01485, partial [Atopobiaceae bacterium]|nr:hypothetical protein [Atopobiaceae bacterium]